ncbi:protocadherin beta-16-like [Centroberyx affinis]|uniref:protocadherin beta-16-like n=1 Tax=Centroberyx affinis TaxID=166261 RepID=UPI003A5BC7AF
MKSSSNNFYSLVTDSDLDRERASEYNISVTCFDEGVPSLSSSVTLTLQISDVNDNAPVFERSSYEAYIVENNTPGLSIFTVKARDADWNQNARVSYILEDSSVNGVPVSSYVSVSADSGVIHAVRSFDYEQIKDFQFHVKAQDGGSPPLSSNVTVKILIQDQNDNAPQVLYPVQTGGSLVAEMVPRSADVGYLVTKVVAVDVDSGQNAWLSYKLQKATDRALFEVGLQNGEIRTIRQVTDKDAVKQRLTVVVEDNGQPSRSATVNVNVAVADSFPEVLSEFTDFTHDKETTDSRKSDCKFGRAGSQNVLIMDPSSTGTMQRIQSEKSILDEPDSPLEDGGSPPLSSNVTVKILIQDQNDNAPQVLYPVQTGGSLVAEMVPRSADVGYLVTKVVAVDVDSGQNAWLSYKLQKATDRALFEVGLQNGEIRTIRQVTDKDAVKQRLTVVVEDNGQPSRSATVNVNVAVADSFPEVLSEFTDFTHDKDGNLPVIPYYPPLYADVGGTGTLKHVFNYEVCGTTDSRKSDIKYSRPFSQSTLNIDHDGTRTVLLWWHLFFLLWSTIDGQTRYTIPEELKQGSVVGNLAKDLGLVVSELYRRKLRITSEAGKQYFSVDLGKGELVVSDRIDREDLCGQRAPCLLPLEVVIENPLQLHRVEIDIQDINDNSPSFITKERILKIAESINPGARFPLESALDPDVVVNTVRTYTISKNDHFKLNIKNHKDGSKYPELVLEKSLDREKQPVHKLILTAVDGGDPVRSGTSEITVTVLDINDNAPQFERQVYEANVSENAVHGTEILHVKATDADEGLNGEIEYFFGEQTADLILSLFDIEPSSGAIVVKGILDYEKNHLHRFDVIAKDKGNPEMDGHCGVEIKIVDINDNTPEIIVTSLTTPVPEDSATGTVIALISAKDPDSGDNGKVKLSLSSKSPFKLNPSVSNHYTLVTNGPLDREKNGQYSIKISAVDSGKPSLSSEKIITVELLDINDNPPVFSQPSYVVYVKENYAPGKILCSVSATDPDLGENAKISYSILDSKVQDVSVSSYVYINSDNGSIYSMHSFDYEKLKVFQIRVQAKDQGSPSLSSNATVHVFILDQNDNAPAVIYPSSAALGSLSHQRMPRSAKAGHLVTKVTAVDADSGHNAWISYKLAEATDASLFTVNLYTGEVRTKRPVSEQDDSSQRLLIEIKDDGEPVQSATVTVSILLEDGLHEPILDLRQKAAEPSKKTGRLTLYLILSLASVSVLSLLTFLILAVKCIRNSRSSGSCCMRRSDCDGYKNPNRNLQIQLNTDGPIKYVEVLGGDMLSQSQSFRSCLSPMSEYSDFTFVKPSSTTDFKEMINVLDASLPDSTWTFESQQVTLAL